MTKSAIRRAFVALFIVNLLFAASVSATQTDINAPTSNINSGQSITILPNGNIVIIDRNYSIPAGAANVGAVHLYDGATLTRISTLTGSTAGDQIGDEGITVLTNGNYIVRSPNWDNAGVANVGAATFVNGMSGLNGTVSAANSLVGSSANDQVSDFFTIAGITALTNGNYIVRSPFWDNGGVANAGAVTFGNGTTGVSGIISAVNSLVGSLTNDQVASHGVTILINGNYIVRSPFWDNAGLADVGAATFGNGATGVTGTVSATNSLIGSSANDSVGIGVTALTNGNYVVRSYNWDNAGLTNVGAATFGNGTTGLIGTVSSANSLIGSSTNDSVGIEGTALTNGNYVVSSQFWDSAGVVNVGAVTFGNGMSGVTGTVSAANSLIGSSADDSVGDNGVTALTNGNYVVRSYIWDNAGLTDAGAVTFGNGTTGVTGTVSAANSLVGSSAMDFVGLNIITALTNGNYVVATPSWDSGSVQNVGAVTFGNGMSGVAGTVSAANSIIGSSADDRVGGNGVTALTNGNYVVRSAEWDNASVANVGAATFGNGTTGLIGTVSSANSLIGSSTNDSVGSNGVTALTNGNYVVNSRNWDNAGVTNVGAATFGNGTTGVIGTVSAANSLIGSSADDSVGSNEVTALTNGNYIVGSSDWDNGGILDAGAVTFGNGMSGVTGTVSAANSLVGSSAMDYVGLSGFIALTNGNYVVATTSWDNGGVQNVGAVTFGNGTTGTVGAITSGASGGNSVVGTASNGIGNFAFDATRNRLVVGRPINNLVSVLFFNTNVTADGAINDPAIYNNGLPNGLINAIIPSGRSVSLSGVSNIGQVQVQCGGNLTNASASNYIIGSVRKDFCASANESFTYPLGDANNYSPMTASNVSGTGSLTAAATDNFLTDLPAARSVSRYWSLTGAGITTNLTFIYTDADVNGDESNYRIFKRNLNLNQPITSTVNAAANTATATNISNFSDWSVSQLIAAPPTAATVLISGRVVSPQDLGLTNAIVTLTDSQGVSRSVLTGKFGNFIFREVEAGKTYILRVSLKRYTFAPQIISPTENLANITFTPQ